MPGVLLLLSLLLTGVSPAPQAIAAPAGGIVGFAALDLATGRTLALHDNEGFPMASVFKLPVAIAVLHQVDARKLSLARMVTLAAADARGGKAPVIAAPGRETVGRLLEAMTVDSDNTACDKLLSLVGGPAAVDAQIRKLGVEGIAIRMTEQDMLAGKGDNMATPAAMVALLAKVARGQLGLSRASARHLDKLLLAVTTGPNRLKAGVPPGTPVAHKTGTSGTTNGVTDATNDAGLLGTGKARIAVAVFVRASPADEATRERVIADLARDGVGNLPRAAGSARRKLEVERRAAAELALGPDTAAVALDDPVHGRQTDAGPLELGLLVQALERGEQPVRVLHVEAGAVVAHEEHGARARPAGYARRPRCARCSTREEYFQALPSRFSIAARSSPASRGAAQAGLRPRRRPRAPARARRSCATISSASAVRSTSARASGAWPTWASAQQIVDQRRHAPDRALDARRGSRSPAGAAARRRLQHQRAARLDDRQRRAQVVADHRVERLEVAHRRLDRARALGDAPLEVGVQLSTASSASLRSVMSWQTPTSRTSLPASSSTGCAHVCR